MRYRALIAPSILSVLVVSAAGVGASADARRMSLADAMDRASNVRGGASATIVPVRGQGLTIAPWLRGRRGKAHERARG